jgi:hypothetical protein
VVHGRAEPGERYGESDRVFRPRPATAKIAAVVCAALLALSLATGSRDAIWLAGIPFLLLAQCFQSVHLMGNYVRRTGLRAVQIDMATAKVKATGRSWWVELFFLGRCLEIRDADGRGLLLESWLWSKAMRTEILEMVRTPTGESMDGTREPHDS